MSFSLPGDTLSSVAISKKISSLFRSSLSTSYIIQKDFSHEDVRNFLFVGNADYHFKVSRQKFIQSYLVRADLGFLKFVDSTWTKYADNWKLNILFNENSSDKITHAYALNVSSQFLNTYRYIADADEGYVKQWRGSFFNPATISFSYNVSIELWDYSSILLGLSSVRVSTKPRYEGVVEPKSTPFAKTERSYILASYGMSGQVNIYSKKISENITWDNTSLFFVNGVSKDQVNADFQNRITFKFLKYLQFRLDTHLMYDPLYSYGLQYTQEFLIGVFYEKRK